MSTRSIIVITNKEKTIRVYRHYDGYPTSALEVILKSIKLISSAGDTNLKKLEEKLGLDLNPDNLAQSVLKVAELRKDCLEGEYNEAFKPEHLGNQGDLEWIYVVNTDTHTVNVYGGGYTGNIPQHAYAKGTVDPLSYAKRLYPEYQEQETLAMKVAMREIEELGFKINTGKGKKPTQRKKKQKSEMELN